MIDERNILAVIIGRAGSKGLPGKNMKMLANQPIVMHSIVAANAATLVDEVLISTDSDIIKKQANDAGIAVVNRPRSLASDTATVDAAVRHAVEVVASDAQVIVIMYANVPIRPAGLIDEAIIKLAEHDADSVQSYAPVGKYHPWWMSRISTDGCVEAYDDHGVYRRQELPPLYVPDGGVIVVTRDSLFTIAEGRPHAFLGRKRYAVINPAGAVVDIDDEMDMWIAEVALTHKCIAEVRRS